jgi:hypothetical protein
LRETVHQNFVCIRNLRPGEHAREQLPIDDGLDPLPELTLDYRLHPPRELTVDDCLDAFLKLRQQLFIEEALELCNKSSGELCLHEGCNLVESRVRAGPSR